MLNKNSINTKPNGNAKPNNNTEFVGPNNKLNTIEEEPNKENASGNNFQNASNNTFKLNKNTKNKIQNKQNNVNNFNASAELNKQLNNEAKRQTVPRTRTTIIISTPLRN